MDPARERELDGIQKLPRSDVISPTQPGKSSSHMREAVAHEVGGRPARARERQRGQSAARRRAVDADAVHVQQRAQPRVRLQRCRSRRSPRRDAASSSPGRRAADRGSCRPRARARRPRSRCSRSVLARSAKGQGAPPEPCDMTTSCRLPVRGAPCQATSRVNGPRVTGPAGDARVEDRHGALAVVPVDDGQAHRGWRRGADRRQRQAQPDRQTARPGDTRSHDANVL